MKREPMKPFKDFPVSGPVASLAEPVITLFCDQVKVVELTEGEKKAKLIEDSFKNPFQKFLPAKTFHEISQNAKASSEAATENTETGATIGDQLSDDTLEVSHRYTKASERYTKAVERDTKAPKQDKKRNMEGSEDENDAGGALRVKKHKKLKKSTKPNKTTNNSEVGSCSFSPSQFKPYDYNSANLEFGNEKNGEDGKDKRIFNPYKKLGEKGKRYNSRVHMKSGERSMTFNKKK